ncbi:MAG: VWA domain-containing protein [Thiohalomonadales bacterium]
MKYLAIIVIPNISFVRIELTRCSCGISVAQFYSILLLFIYIFVIPSISLSASRNTDLRILIDVSGSMKVNDPQNLRAPSVRLLIGLIPDGTKAGIWTFGKYVNMQVKLGVVDEKWKKNARIEAKKIHSRGLYTNIEDALKKSSFDWKLPDLNTNRHIILLTDGMVDISKDPAINLKSRNKIINYYLPKLKTAGVKIHTIALSKQADHELLKLLSVSTDGWYELIEDPKKLHRIFLRLFEKSTSANVLPLENNLFKVDKSITDMTVLAFNTKETTTKLITPAKKTITEKNKPDSITWFHEDGYDLITITKPEVGDWQLDAPIDKDNRVLVVTNLSLFVNDIPNNVLLNQQILIKAELKQKEKNIHNQNFLKLVKIIAIKKSLNDPKVSIRLYDDGKNRDKQANDGIYNSEIRSPLRAGVFEIVVNAQGPTFQRQRQFLVNVFNGLAEIEIKDGKEKNPFYIEVKPHKGLLQDGSIDISYVLKNGEKIKLNKDTEGFWKAALPAENAGEKISFTIKGLRQNNISVEMQMERVLPERNKKFEKITKIVELQKTDKQKQTKKLPVEGGLLSVMIWVLIINLIFILIALITYFVFKRIRARNVLKDKEDLKL